MEKLRRDGKTAGCKTIFTTCRVAVLLSKYNWWIQNHAWFSIKFFHNVNNLID